MKFTKFVKSLASEGVIYETNQILEKRWLASVSVLMEHVFRFSVLYTAQCTGDVGRTIYIHGLYKSGAPVADYYGSGDGICVAVAAVSYTHLGYYENTFILKNISQKPLKKNCTMYYSQLPRGVKQEGASEVNVEVVNGNFFKMYPTDEFASLAPDRKSTRLNSSHITRSRMPSSA